MVDVKSTGLYKTDPVLKENGVTVDYFKTGHSYIKRRTTELNALAGFEKSGHLFFRAPYGYGYDDGLVAAAAVLQMLDRNPGRTLSDLKAELGDALDLAHHVRRTATTRRSTASSISVVADYQALGKSGGEILGRKIVDVNTVNGARVTLDDGSWVLVRASSNKPELVVVVESHAGRRRHARPLPQRSETAPREVPGSRPLQPGNLKRWRPAPQRGPHHRPLPPPRRELDRAARARIAVRTALARSLPRPHAGSTPRA